jgi:hypothetical protein
MNPQLALWMKSTGYSGGLQSLQLGFALPPPFAQGRQICGLP